MAEALLSIVPLLAVVVAGAIVIRNLGKRLRGLSRIETELMRIARKYNAEFVSGNIIRFPALKIHYRGRLLKLYLTNGRRHEIIAGISFETFFCSKLKLQTMPGDGIEGIGGKKRIQDIRLGDSDFDRAFIVKGHPEEVVRKLLTRPVQRSMQSLRAFHPRLYVTRRRAELIIDQIPDNQYGYEQLINAGLALAREARHTGG